MSDCGCELGEAASPERRTLGILLLINGAMFITEGVAGWIAQSTGLMADSLDMLADACVYGVAFYAVGHSARMQAQAATATGLVQITLGIGVLIEVVHRYLYESEPSSVLMMAVGTAALIANVACLMLIAKHRDAGVHMRASWIFSTNDVISNLGVVVSGVLVALLNSRLPDLAVGAVVSVLVVRGGLRIVTEAKAATGR